MLRSRFLLAATSSIIALGSPALAGGNDGAEQSGITIEQAAALLQYHYSSANDRFRMEIAPNYSEELGWSLKGAAGGYLTDELALGIIVEYGQDKREYLANAGIQFNDSLSLVGTIGMLEEHIEFFEGEGKEAVQQMEYGASLKGDFDIGLLSGFELNGYLADADTDYEFAEAGKVYGVQLMTDFDISGWTHLKLGGGYEWLEWDAGEGNKESFSFRAEGSQRLTDALSLNARAKLGVSENVYGAGLLLDLSNGGPNTNMVGLSYSYIDGREGIEDDQRVELGWTIGFGAGPSTSVAGADLADSTGTIRATADAVTVSPANNLLSDVMKRPSFLPERVIARGVEPEETSDKCLSGFRENPEAFEWIEVGVWYVDSVDLIIDNGNDVIDIDSWEELGVGNFDLFLSQDPSEPVELTPLGSKKLEPDVNSGVFPVTGQLNIATDERGKYYLYNESIWTVIEDEGTCKAIYWGED